MKKEFVLKCCKKLELGGGGGGLSGNVVFAKLSWQIIYLQHGLRQIIFSSFTKTGIHIYYQIFCLFFTTMLYKLLKRKDQGLSPRNCFINILKLYYTAVQNRVVVYASTLTFKYFIQFWQCQGQNINFLASGGHFTLKGNIHLKYLPYPSQK